MKTRALAILALVLGTAAAFAGNPYGRTRGRIDVDELATIVAREEDQVAAPDLQEWIRSRKPGLRLLDLRTPAEFTEYHIPTAERVSLPDLARYPVGPRDVVVLYASGIGGAAQAWVFLRALGHHDVYVLRGGLEAWLDDVLGLGHETTSAAKIARARRGGC